MPWVARPVPRYAGACGEGKYTSVRKRPQLYHRTKLRRPAPLRCSRDLDIPWRVLVCCAVAPPRLAHGRLDLAGGQDGSHEKATAYTGWDGRQLTGHLAGHHLSAVSLMWAATGDVRFKQRADVIVAELKIVQDANGDGFASALMGVREAFADVSLACHTQNPERSDRTFANTRTTTAAVKIVRVPQIGSSPGGFAMPRCIATNELTDNTNR